MASALSAYWVQFFRNAGFPQDVATKYAVVFSNNRIKPDMLPDLDKPSLKEMGITLMGDMIAILRYAKKVVEDTTCEKFLVDSEDSQPTAKFVSKPVVKKVVAKVAPKSTVLSKAKPAAPIKSVSSAPSSTIVKKKVASNVTRLVQREEKKPAKRKIEKKIVSLDSDSDEEWKAETQKRLKAAKDDVEYKVIMPKGTTVRSQQILKKAVEQKLTVFDRLGDSSVTSTTNLPESSTTFNITGLGKDMIKRNSSVFNRLGDKDLLKKDETPFTGILKNGSSAAPAQGILKTRVSPKTTVISLNKNSKGVSKLVGTMRADQELKAKTVSNSVKQLIKHTQKITVNERRSPMIVKKIAPTYKLASERALLIPAKARLGTTKQVTFNSFASVAHIKKPGVFSRLGI
ncbi:uncharacterized protein C19orf47 homolog [Belonocnema kinseyi]|uniref:uncharacterized protein C19orf47 homolog n=1 Tax=Belonocnema kinseyi TaxID=2817044 RepID=UPI00143DFDF4|nr:uncharacterized protein C19orf47 homolog [Belonocnema kinseyi]